MDARGGPARWSASGWRLALPALALLAGIAVQLQQPALWPAPWAGAVLLLSLAVAGAGRRHLGLLLPALAAAGFALTDLRAGLRLAEHLPTALEGVDLPVEGRIVGLPQTALTGTRFVFVVDRAPAGVPDRLSLSWFRGPDADALLAGPPQDLAPGQRWAFTVRLKAPHGSLNPHGFDLELWMFERGLRAGGYVRAAPAHPPRLLAEADGAGLDRLRLHLRRAIQAQVPEPRLAGVLAALVVGDQGAIELGIDNQVLRRAHL